ncbi:MAG: hypothetical protein J5858_17165 [Lentisphaeria bacterium]|nr:hypothetical protein [Lentisphaeria bacterium]
MSEIKVLDNGNVLVTFPISLRFRSGRRRVIFSENDTLGIDPLVINLARAFRWQELIDSGTYRNTIELAKAIGKDHAFVARTVRLTLLAPEIIHAILAGTLRKSIPMEKLRKEMPARWEDQKKLFGIE